MSNLLIVYEREITTVSILMENFQTLFDKTEIHILFRRSIDVKPYMINHVDIVMLVRPQDICSWNVAKAASLAGVFLVFFCDDDLLNMPESYPHIPWRLQCMKRMLSISDIVLSGSTNISEKYGKACRGKRGCVANTIVEIEDLKKIPEKDITKDVKIVYAAGKDHEDLFHGFVEPILYRLDKRYGKMLSLTFVGVRPNIDRNKYSFQIQYKEGMPLQEYREYMRKEQFDIGLAPLHNNPVSACKYFNKYIEYTLAGTVGIYSNCKPYTLVIENTVNGFLADNTKEGWFEAICQAVDENDLRQKCLKNAIQHLEQKHSYEKIRAQLLKDIPEFKEKRKHRSLCRSLVGGKILYRLFRIGDITYLFFFYLKRENIGSLITRIKRHF